jgi:uncharacterized protein (TIRG00374 family)
MTTRRWRWLAALALVAFVTVFVWANRHEVPKTWRALVTAQPLWCAAAAAVMLTWMVNDTLLQRATLRATGVELPVGKVAVGAAVAHFLNLTTKSAGMAGLAAMRAEARRAGMPERSVTAGYLLAGILTQLAFAVALAASIVVMAVGGRLTTAELGVTAVFALYTGGQVLIMVTAARNRDRLRSVFRVPARVVAFVRRKPPTDGFTRTDAAADELFETFQKVRGSPRALAPAMIHALATEVIAVAILWSSAHAVGASVRPLDALVGYSVAGLFAIIGFLPSGFGFVEVSLGAVLVGYGAAAGTAAAAVLLFRVFELWLPVVIGAALARRLRVVHR